MEFAARPGKGNRQPYRQLGRIGSMELDAVKPEKLISLLDDAINDIFDRELYDELLERESDEREQFQTELKRYVEDDL